MPSGESARGSHGIEDDHITAIRLPRFRRYFKRQPNRPPNSRTPLQFRMGRKADSYFPSVSRRAGSGEVAQSAQVSGLSRKCDGGNAAKFPIKNGIGGMLPRHGSLPPGVIRDLEVRISHTRHRRQPPAGILQPDPVKRGSVARIRSCETLLQETVSRALVGGVPKSVRDISFGPTPRVLTLL
jgi:hypothetical protein